MPEVETELRKTCLSTGTGSCISNCLKNTFDEMIGIF